MATKFKNEFVDKIQAQGLEQGREQGRAQGLAKMILQVLDARHVAVPDEIRDQVQACTDITQLDAWGYKAATAQSIEDVFGTADGSS